MTQQIEIICGRTDVSSEDYQDSQVHKDLLLQVKQQCKKHIIENKIPPEKIGKLLYQIYRPNSSTAFRRAMKREHFSNKAIG